MNLIAAVDKHWAIGRDGRLLVSIPQDQKMFREETLGKAIVMGRKTLESFPGGKPLYGRRNVVLTRDPDYRAAGAVVCHSVEEALRALEDIPDDQIYVIGGQSIYEQFLPRCDVAHVTWIDFAYEADAHFPNLDESSEWELAAVSEEQTYFDLCYEYRMYKKR